MTRLKAALEADYVVLGGGNSKNLKALPAGAELGDNRNAFIGGTRLWNEEAKRARARIRPAPKESIVVARLFASAPG